MKKSLLALPIIAVSISAFAGTLTGGSPSSNEAKIIRAGILPAPLGTQSLAITSTKGSCEIPASLLGKMGIDPAAFATTLVNSDIDLTCYSDDKGVARMITFTIESK